jgi:hypothetical protein
MLLSRLDGDGGFVVALGSAFEWSGLEDIGTSGNVWTTSGVTAGIDGMLALVASIWEEETAEKVSTIMEHNRARQPDDDPWAKEYDCRDVLPITGT